MRSYTVKKIQGAPQWNTVPVMPIDTVNWLECNHISAQAQICWDPEALYVRLEATEAQIRMEERGPVAMPCLDSCLEFFFSPADRVDYLNFEFNPNCALWLGYGTCGKDLIRLLVPDIQELFNPQVEFTAGGWGITYKIPFAFVRRFFREFTPAEGVQMRANAYKCGSKTVNPHYLSWNPMTSQTPDFHCPKDYGILTLGGE